MTSARLGFQTASRSRAQPEGTEQFGITALFAVTALIAHTFRAPRLNAPSCRPTSARGRSPHPAVGMRLYIDDMLRADSSAAQIDLTAPRNAARLLRLQ